MGCCYNQTSLRLDSAGENSRWSSDRGWICWDVNNTQVFSSCCFYCYIPWLVWKASTGLVKPTLSSAKEGALLSSTLQIPASLRSDPTSSTAPHCGTKRSSNKNLLYKLKICDGRWGSWCCSVSFYCWGLYALKSLCSCWYCTMFIPCWAVRNWGQPMAFINTLCLVSGFIPSLKGAINK